MVLQPLVLGRQRHLLVRTLPLATGTGGTAEEGGHQVGATVSEEHRPWARTAVGYAGVPEAQSCPSPTGPPPAVCCLADPKNKFLPEDLPLLSFPGVLAGSPCTWESQSPSSTFHLPKPSRRGSKAAAAPSSQSVALPSRCP